MSTETEGETVNLQADSAWGQIIGTRDYQQDRAAIVNWPNGFSLYILADGMGGHVAGDEASELVVQTFRQHFVESDQTDIKQRFIDAVSAANLAIYEKISASPELDGMGSTFLALVFDGSSAQWISIGDSPLWLFRQGELVRLNENHSMASVLAKQVEEGIITAEEAASSPERSQLLEAVLGRDIKMVDAPEEAVPLKSGDILILASDGVETCSIDELQSLLAEASNNPELQAEDLVTAILEKVKAHNRPSQDNSTVNVVRILDAQADIATVQKKTDDSQTIKPLQTEQADLENQE